MARKVRHGRSDSGMPQRSRRDRRNLISPRRVASVESDGTAGNETATDGHPFWVELIHQWTPPASSNPAHGCTSAGTYVQISAVQVNTIHQRVRNLTVADIHTYYVVASRRKVDSYWRVFKVMP
jgi:hypothetical protein